MGTPKRKTKTKGPSRPTPKLSRGRPSSYRPEFVPQVQQLCEIGCTEYEVAEFFKVSVNALWRWRIQHPEFRQAMSQTKEMADERVTGSLYHRAVGYTFKSEKVFQHKGEIVRTNT